MASDAPRLRLAHSPDSDDLVMWWPLVGMRSPEGDLVEGDMGSPKIDLEGTAFELIAEDVESLNTRVSYADHSSPFDITAISAAAYPAVSDRWVITRCGGSFGAGYGPKVVVRSDAAITGAEQLRGTTIAVPGRKTSAFTTLAMMLGGTDVFAPREMPFDQVADAVMSRSCDAGLLIHEAQLMVESIGLREIADLGAWWTQRTALPLPLGLNVVRRDLDERFGEGTIERVSRVLARSVAYAIEHADESRQYLLMHAGDRPEWRDDMLVRRYLEMYVSRMSLDMGDIGSEALGRFLGEAAQQGLVPPCEVDVV